jgi:hypothetical protein
MAESKAASVGGLFHFRAAIVTGHTRPRGAFELGAMSLVQTRRRHSLDSGRPRQMSLIFRWRVQWTGSTLSAAF